MLHEHAIDTIIQDTYLPIGSLIATQGRTFVVTGYKSGINYTAKDVNKLDSTYLLKRQGRYTYKGQDDTAIIKIESLTPELEMGDIVLIDRGSAKFKGKVGIISRAGARVHIAIAGGPTITASPQGLVKVSREVLVGYLVSM